MRGEFEYEGKMYTVYAEWVKVKMTATNKERVDAKYLKSISRIDTTVAAAYIHVFVDFGHCTEEMWLRNDGHMAGRMKDLDPLEDLAELIKECS